MKELLEKTIQDYLREIVRQKGRKLTGWDRFKMYIRHPLSARASIAWYDKVYKELHERQTFTAGGKVGNWPPPAQDEFIFTEEALLAMSACAKVGAATIPEISEALTKWANETMITGEEAAKRLSGRDGNEQD